MTEKLQSVEILERLLRGITSAKYALQEVEKESQNLPLLSYERTRPTFLAAKESVELLQKTVNAELDIGGTK